MVLYKKKKQTKPYTYIKNKIYRDKLLFLVSSRALFNKLSNFYSMLSLSELAVIHFKIDSEVFSSGIRNLKYFNKNSFLVGKY